MSNGTVFLIMMGSGREFFILSLHTHKLSGTAENGAGLKIRW